MAETSTTHKRSNRAEVNQPKPGDVIKVKFGNRTMNATVSEIRGGRVFVHLSVPGARDDDALLETFYRPEARRAAAVA